LNAPASSSLTVRLVRAFGGRDGTAAEPSPPFEWDPGRSRSGRRLGPAVRALAGRFRGVASAADAAGAALSRRPALLLAAAVLAVPLLRILLPPVPAAALSLVLAAAAGCGVLLAAARALHAEGDRRLVAAALLAGLLLRAALAAAMDVRGAFPDEEVYHRLAADSAGCWGSGGPSLLAESPMVRGRAAYFYLLSADYLLAGPFMAAGRVMGGLLGLLAALLAGEVARPLAGPRTAALAVALLALHPEHAFWSVTLSRDVLSTVLVLATLAALLKRPGALLRGNLLAVAAPLGVLCLNSIPAACCLGATVAACLLAEAAAGAREGLRGAALAAAAVAAAGSALFLVGWRYGSFLTPSFITGTRILASRTEPGILLDLRFTSPLDLVSNLPAGLAFAILSPWPWAAGATHRSAYGVLSVAGLAVTLLGIAGLLASARRRPAAAAPLLLFAGLMLVLLALFEGNAGILVRHRLPLTAVLACGAAALLAGLRPRGSP